ncbi:MAG: hypothetical protein Q8R13_03395 [bacterium]|nr:hypothetical protein [bacterium]MDZ4296262.1 hypothetical protein [Patescibacteria group bacterium]MDZ4296291.1 hypothetical protein [Patescibacteria group bacterium]
MAIPTITLIKKTAAAQPTPYWQKLLIGGAILLALASASVTMWIFGAVSLREEALKEKTDRLATLDSTALAAVERSKDASAGIQPIPLLLDQHVYPTALFEFLETMTLPEVVWKSMEVRFRDPVRLQLRGEGRTVQGIAQQVRRFQESPLVVSVTVEGVSLESTGRIMFDLEIVPNRNMWLKSKPVNNP